MEEREILRRSKLGWHQSCFFERIGIPSCSMECNHSSRNAFSQRFPKVVREKLENFHTKRFKHVTSVSTKDLFETRVEKELGSEHVQRSEVGQLTGSFQSNQPIFKIQFVRERGDQLLIMRISVMRSPWWMRRTWTSEFQGYHILLWSMRKVPAFENWFRKLRTSSIDTLFNKIHDKIKFVTHSVQNQRKWFRMWATSNCVKCSTRNPKRSEKYVYRIGTSASSIARASTSWAKEEKFIQYTMDFFFYYWLLHKERATSRAPLREEARRQRIPHRPSSKRSAKRNTTSVSTIFFSRWQIPQEYDWNWSNRRSLSPNGWSCGRRSYPPFDSTRSWQLQK